MRHTVALCTLLLFSLLTEYSVRADSDIDIRYDIFSRGDTIMVWLDLSPFLTSAQISRLNDGIDLLFQTELRLAVPRRLWGDVTTAETQQALRMSYHVVTKEYALSATISDWDERLFPSLAQLSSFLADSINAPLVPMDSLDRGKHYTLDLKVTTIALTGFSPSPEATDSSYSESPLQFLFKKFLSLTGFGRREFETKSRPFSKSEILPEHTIGQ